ncbi:MAG TPA: glycosyltransferase family 4 protein [Candidatus Angelobacter sp.]|jgi:glycogen(starch) synthase|nr:glycosyltransferase family 4 protein [Candidatus Angelobacter sp.]
MRVCIASYDDDPPEGGQGVYVRGLRDALQLQGVEVRTVSGRGANAIHYPRILHRAPLDFSLALTRDPAPLLQPRPDVVHAQGGPGGVLLPRRIDVPLVYTAHHTYRQAYRQWAPRRALSPLERRSYRLAQAVIAVSPSTAQAVRAIGFQNVEVIPPGIDLEALARHGESLRDPGLVLFAGRLEPEKGPLDAVAVMRALEERDPRVHGVVAGSGSLDVQVRDAARRSRAVDVRGRVSDDELRRLYASAAVLVVPSRYEGLGMVALEAMAAGAAVVGFDVTGLRDAVGERGVLVPPGDTAAMARAVGELLADPARRAEVVERSVQAVRRTHSWGTCAEAVQEMYRQVATPR